MWEWAWESACPKEWGCRKKAQDLAQSYKINGLTNGFENKDIASFKVKFYNCEKKNWIIWLRCWEIGRSKCGVPRTGPWLYVCRRRKVTIHNFTHILLTSFSINRMVSIGAYADHPNSYRKVARAGTQIFQTMQANDNFLPGDFIRPAHGECMRIVERGGILRFSGRAPQPWWVLIWDWETWKPTWMKIFYP